MYYYMFLVDKVNPLNLKWIYFPIKGVHNLVHIPYVWKAWFDKRKKQIYESPIYKGKSVVNWWPTHGIMAKYYNVVFHKNHKIHTFQIFFLK